MTSVYEAAGGPDGLLALAHAWHERCLSDPVANHPFTHPGQNPLHVVGYTGELRDVLHDYFAWATTRMAAHPDTADTVPAGEVLPHWGWKGRFGDGS